MILQIIRLLVSVATSRNEYLNILVFMEGILGGLFRGFRGAKKEKKEKVTSWKINLWGRRRFGFFFEKGVQKGSKSPPNF